MKKYLLGIAASMFLGLSSAYAFQCPLDIRAIDNALPKVNLSAEQRAEVQRLRDEGEALHNAGKHGESVNKLAEAMRIILNNM